MTPVKRNSKQVLIYIKTSMGTSRTDSLHYVTVRKNPWGNKVLLNLVYDYLDVDYILTKDHSTKIFNNIKVD